MWVWLLRSMTELTSRKWISRLTGSFAQSSLSRLFIKKFAAIYHIAVDEAEKPLNQYRTLNEFFTRRLKAGMRPIDSTTQAVISPVDALITSCGSIENGTLLNVKGQDYSIAELLQDAQSAKRYDYGYYYVLYLSPTDYHRIHVPVDGTIINSVHLPGKVYPVNHFGLTNMKAVLSRNERLITYFESHNKQIAAVKVGAMNVSSIHYVHNHDLTNTTVTRGDDLAYFAFGSTVVLLVESDAFLPDHTIGLNSKVKMGQKLGTLLSN